ncbi:MAG: NAD(P)-dependent oxidoreductase [Cyanobacteria bacterium CRU_2_1]|nr:NAD(P)-dependent oxidoreductase [Cyanobacteria bacterium RU_5_0]NJR59135.1 NAD(P)-dependent oxidoreductase [Cyanobacteria bacterium CRU_2_1]
MKKLLITGASGFLGWHLCQSAQAHWEVYGTYHAHPISLPGTALFQADLTDFRSLQLLIQTIQPDAIVHAAALSQPNACQANPEASHRINVMASWNLAGLCAESGIPIAFTSSELVFNGLNPPYREMDPVSPINLYGEQKVAAEIGILERCPDAVICRMPLMFGVAPYAQSFVQPFVERLRSGQVLNLFVDEIRTPVSGTSAAQGILLALDKTKGRIHLGGKERLSRYEFGLMLIEVLQLTDVKINPCCQANVPMTAPRAPDLSMDSSIAFHLGYQPGIVKDELLALVEKL